MIKEETIKEKVIRLAKINPFYTNKEIAQKANTTVSYVRTILSEEGISLKEMRKQRYQKLYQRLYGKEENNETS